MPIIEAGWQLSPTSVPFNAVVRARGFIAVTPSSWFVEIAPPRLFGAGFYTATFGFNIIGALGQVLVVDGSADLANWTALSTNALVVSPTYFADPGSTNLPSRFYRTRVK